MSGYPFCIICSDTEPEFFCRKDSADILRCRKCGFIFTREIHSASKMEGHYSKGYFEPYLKTRAVHVRKRFRKRLGEIRRLRFPGALLDVGCGAGFFLKLAREEGYETSGVELSEWASRAARERLGLRVFNGELKDAAFSPESFDVITLWHILEHVADPKGLLLHTHRLLKAGGILALEVPNIGSPAAGIAGRNWELLAPREHFYYFDPWTIGALLQSTGFAAFRQQTYFWTTPEMVLRDRAEMSRGLMKYLFRVFSCLLLPFSILRFNGLKGFIDGDVLTIYAVKL